MSDTICGLSHFHPPHSWGDLNWCPGDPARPLVVIDPEDREAVERLVSAFCEQPNWYADTRRQRSDAMQAALREFANPKPPKPDEPTGLGAVVEDADGRLHVRTSGHIVNPWRSEADETSRSWARVAAVRVLSEGVQP